MQAIVAMDPNRVIGKNGKIPWHYSEDLKWFKKATFGNCLLMGRNTFESIGKHLPDRFAYILTNDTYKLLLPSGTYSCYVNEQWILTQSEKNPNFNKHLWVCGGAKVYQNFLPLCESIYVTHITEEYEGDVYMPEFESMFPNPEIIWENKDFTIAKYSK